MDKWEEMYNKAKKEYHREEVSPYIVAHHVVSAVESEDGEIFTGFCIESASGVMNLCAERVAALNMYMNTGKTKIKKLIVFRDSYGSSIIPFLAENYHEILVLDLRYVKFDNLQNLDIDLTNPDDVLFIYSINVINNSFSLK